MKMADPSKIDTSFNETVPVKSPKDNSRYMKYTALLLIGCVACLVLFILFATGVINVKRKPEEIELPISVSSQPVKINGTTYHTITLSNKNDMTVALLDYGGTIMSIKVPDKQGKIDDVTLGFSKVEDYLTRKHYYGTLIGRYANRIANGSFMIDGIKYHVTLNEGNPPNRQLHGGIKGWDKVHYNFTLGKDYVEFHHVSKDGDQGYPGEVKFTARVRLTEDNQLQLELKATTTKPTPINLTTHPFFNLKGHYKGTIINHEVAIFASSWLEVTNELIPTGNIIDVDGTVFDLRSPRSLHEVIWNVSDTTQGYDHNFCLSGPTGKRLAARVTEPTSGRVMEVFTNQPGLQFYTGNFMNDDSAKGGASYSQYSGFAMEPQNYPDAPNHDNFPDSILRPGSTYENFISYKFSST